MSMNKETAQSGDEPYVLSVISDPRQNGYEKESQYNTDHVKQGISYEFQSLINRNFANLCGR